MKLTLLIFTLLGSVKAFAPPAAFVANPLSSLVLLSSGIPRVFAATPDESKEEATDLVVLEVDVEEAKKEIARNWGFILTSGVLNVLGGSLATFLPVYATGVAYTMVAASLAILGVVGVAGTFYAEKGMKAKSLIFGAANLFLYYRMWHYPFESVNILTAYILAFTITDGLHESAFAIQNKELPHRNWNFLSGLSSIAVGVYAAIKMPVSSMVVPGICLGINLITSGISKVAIGLFGQEEANSRMGFA